MNRVGVDLISVSDIERSVDDFGDRFRQRLFTQAEVAYAAGSPAECNRRLAARFAAKEAAIKVLRPEAEWLDRRLIEVTRHPRGWCELELHGEAQALAQARGLDDFSLSMSHEGDQAVAVVGATARSLVYDDDAEDHDEVEHPAMNIRTFSFHRGPSAMSIDDKIRTILKEQGRLTGDPVALGVSDNLYQAGLTSHASVNVMLALEGAFDVEFPDRMLKRGVFESIASIRAAIQELTAGQTQAA